MYSSNYLSIYLFFMYLFGGRVVERGYKDVAEDPENYGQHRHAPPEPIDR